MVRCYIALGGNQGDVPATFRAAAKALTRLACGRPLLQSRLYRTVPIGSAAGEAYYNALAALDSDLPPDELLTGLQEIERQFGRTRTVHWGPRPLDLDLISCGDAIQATERLTLPHPHAWYRRFVLDPWNDVASEAVHPVLRETVRELRNRLMIRPLPVALTETARPAESLRQLQEIVLVEADQKPALTFATRSNPARRIIGVESADDPTGFISQILQAALDQPVPVSGPEWTIPPV